ncbi:MAG: hypothetical protein ACSHXK_14935 [Oceanococcus sp.]
MFNRDHFRYKTCCLILVGVGLQACSDRSSELQNDVIVADDTSATRTLANQCVGLHAADLARGVTKRDQSYQADALEFEETTGFLLRPTDLQGFLIFDPDGHYLSATINGVVAQDAAGAVSEWQILPSALQEFHLQSRQDERWLSVSPDGDLQLSATTPSTFRLDKQSNCLPFPEAKLGASGQIFSGIQDDGSVFGIADAHTHISAYQRLGGRFIHGDAFHPLGVEHALTDCSENHGPEGSMDFVGHFVRDGVPLGSHVTAGWPDFPGWPTHDTYSHQQTYYMWVKRAWMAGLRLLVNHTSGDEQLCMLNPIRDTDCDEMEQVRRQVAGMYALQDYIDAQAGGPDLGWFRIVTDAVQAREIIQQGKLAVILGIEASKLFHCGEFLDAPECGEADIDAGIDEFFDLGIRSVFLAHWFDNAFGGAGLFDQSELTLNALNKPETGHYYRVEACPEPDMGANLTSVAPQVDADNPIAQAINQALLLGVPSYPPGPHCNSKGLTDLGAYVVRQLAARGMIIETDHLGAKMKNQVLDIVEELNYPVVSGHYHAGGTSSPSQHQRILALGGIAAPIKPRADDYPGHVRDLQTKSSSQYYFGVPMSTDSGGIASLPGVPREDDVRVSYPFTSYDGQVTFERQVTGNRTFDYNEEGIAHYGLFAEWIHAVGKTTDGDYALQQLFRSAEAYLRMWERTGVNQTQISN